MMEKMERRTRIWEIDALRGLAFVLMVFDHITFDLGRLFKYIWFTGPTDHWLYQLCDLCENYRETWYSYVLRILLVSGVFLFVSGISANFSKNNVKRGLKLLVISLGLTLVTFLFGEITGNRSMTVFFGILHCLAFCMLLTPLFLKLNRWVLFGLGTVVLVFGFLLEYRVIVFASPVVDFLNHYFLLVPFNIYGPRFYSGDYYPLIPYVGLYIYGILFGQKFYPAKQSLFKTDRKVFFLNWAGRNALWLYFAHQVILLVIFYLIGIIFF